MLHARYVLAFDSALNGCSARLFDVKQNKCVTENDPMDRGQAEHLVPMIDRVLKKAGVAYEDLDVIGVTVGPGAFTGLRIGLSTARALGLALDKPVIGVTTLEAIARHYLQHNSPGDDETLAVVLDTKRADFYVQFFRPEGVADIEAADMPEATLFAAAKNRKMIVIGDGVHRLKLLERARGWNLVQGHDRPDPETLAKITTSLYGHAKKDTVFTAPTPLYLRPPDVSTPKRPNRTLIEN